jgi:2-C-methyl-D-erythritol 4-phosphate cytidylyltransferase
LKQIFGLVPAGGVGARMGADRPKQYLRLGSRSLLERSLCCLLVDARVVRVYVVVAPDDPHAPGLALPERCEALAVGGATRAESVRNGLRAALPAMGKDAWVLVHDAARPCLAAGDLAALIDEGGRDEQGGLLAVPVSDTVKQAQGGHGARDARVARTVDRSGLWRALTPQFFPGQLLLRALEAAGSATELTDDASAVERLGLHPRLVAGDAGNIKVTAPGDLPLAEAVLRAQGRW